VVFKFRFCEVWGAVARQLPFGAPLIISNNNGRMTIKKKIKNEENNADEM
jgi:hypothetical protein